MTSWTGKLAWLTTPASPNGKPDGIAIDKRLGNIYVALNGWVNSSITSIVKINIATKAVSTFATGFGNAVGVAIDPTYTTLYIADTASNKIFSKLLSDTDTTTKTQITTVLASAFRLVVDPTNTNLYVVSYQDPGALTRIPINNGVANGAGKVTFIQYTWSGCTGLVIDSTNTTMYLARYNRIIAIPIASLVSQTAFDANPGSVFYTIPPPYTIMPRTYDLTIDSTNNLYVLVYVTNNPTKTQITKLNIATKVASVFVPASFGLTSAGSLAIDAKEEYMYVVDSEIRTISQIAVYIPLNTYYHVFYTVSSKTPKIMTRTTYDNMGANILDSTDISFGGMNVLDVLQIMDGGGTNPYTIGIVDSSLNKVSMDIAYFNAYTKALTVTQQKKTINYANTFKEPHTAATILTVTVSGGVYWISTDGGATAVQKPSLVLPVGSLYVFDQTNSSGSIITLSSAANRSSLYTTRVVTNGVPGSLNAYTLIDVSNTTPTTLYYGSEVMGGSLFFN